VITVAELDAALLGALPELAQDHIQYHRNVAQDPELSQSFFSYSFVPTLQVAIDRQLVPFCERAFTLIERLIADGDHDVRALLRDEFFGYGPSCEKWMKRAAGYMGPQTLALAKEASK